MAAIEGILTTANADTSDLVGEYQESIFVRNAKGMNAGSTLFGLMSRLKTEPSENNVFNWFERDPVVRQVVIAAANATPPAAYDQPGTIQIDDGAGDTTVWRHLDEGTILYNTTTGEYLRVTVQPGSDTVSVSRAINAPSEPVSGTPDPGYVLTVGDAITIVTLGKTEGALPVRSVYEDPDIIHNYIQTFNSTVELSNAFKANKLRSDAAGPLRARRVQALERIAKDIEFALLFGWRRRIAGGAGYVYTTGGLRHSVDQFAPNNALDGQGATGVTLAAFNDWLQQFMTVGSDAKLGLCGPQAYAAISNFCNSATNGFRIMNQDTVFGMNITTINTPFGVLDLAFHPLLKEIPNYGDWMFITDLAHIVQKTMEPLFLEPNIQTPGQDSYKEQFRAKLGLKLRFAEAFGYAYSLRQIKLS